MNVYMEGGVREWVGTLHHERSAVWLAHSTVTPASQEILIRRNFMSMNHLKLPYQLPKSRCINLDPFTNVLW